MTRVPDADARENTTPQTYVQVDDDLFEAGKAPKNDPERKFRSAWAANGKSIVVDMDRAREVQREALRVARRPLLEALDIEASRADEDGSDKSGIFAKKRRLRDVTKDPRIDQAETPEALAALTLEVLLEPTA